MWIAGVVVVTTVLSSGLNSVVAESPNHTRGLDVSLVHAPSQQVSEARIWLDRGADPVVQAGDRVRIYYRTELDAYVAIFQIDTDGTTRMLYPRSPTENHYARAGRDYRLLFPRSAYWNVDDRPGVGYFFIVTSPAPFDLSDFRYSFYDGGWDLSEVGSTVYSDPYVAMDEYVARLVPDWEFVDYGLDFISYSVGAAHEYPRFLCYQCHGFRPYSVWNPYRYNCLNFRVVVYEDPYFYPYRGYPATRVVVVGPRNPTPPRFEFKERADGDPGTPVRVVRASPRDDGRRVTNQPGTDRAASGGRVAAPPVRPSTRSTPTPRPPARPPQTSTRRPTAGRGSSAGGSSGVDASQVRPAEDRVTAPPTDDRRPSRPSLERRPPPTSQGDRSPPETSRPSPTRSRPSAQRDRPSRPPTSPRVEPSSRPRSSGSGSSTGRSPERSNGSSSARPAPRGRSRTPPARATTRPPSRRPSN
jgi:hypothetical protein